MFKEFGMKIGAIYIITQDSRYTGLLLNSAASLKRVMPDLPITVFTQFPLESSDFERVIRVDGSQDGFYDKTLLMQQTPYERTLFVDADTYIVEPVPELFTMLDQFDFAATHEEYQNTDWHNRYPRPDIPPSFPEFNTGILAYRRSSRMDGVLKDWSDLYHSFLENHPGQKIKRSAFFPSGRLQQPSVHRHAHPGVQLQISRPGILERTREDTPWPRRPSTGTSIRTQGSRCFE
jgi:hypothetical protein